LVEKVYSTPPFEALELFTYNLYSSSWQNASAPKAGGSSRGKLGNLRWEIIVIKFITLLEWPRNGASVKEA
jgi:hypothetical protein